MCNAKGNGPPRWNKLSQKKESTKTTEKCVSPTQLHFFLFKFSLGFTQCKISTIFVLRNRFALFHYCCCCYSSASKLVNIITSVNSNADKKPTARYEPRHCYVRTDSEPIRIRLRMHELNRDWYLKRKNWNWKKRIKRMRNEHILKTKWR